MSDLFFDHFDDGKKVEGRPLRIADNQVDICVEWWTMANGKKPLLALISTGEEAEKNGRGPNSGGIESIRILALD